MLSYCISVVDKKFYPENKYTILKISTHLYVCRY